MTSFLVVARNMKKTLQAVADDYESAFKVTGFGFALTDGRRVGIAERAWLMK